MGRQVLSDNELAVLRALWNTDAPLSRPEILERISGNNWNPNSIHLVLNNLLKKGYIRIEGMARCGQSYGRTYSVTKTQGEYVAGLALNALPGSVGEESILDVMSAMVKSTQLSENTINLLQQMLEEHRSNLKKE